MVFREFIGRSWGPVIGPLWPRTYQKSRVRGQSDTVAQILGAGPRMEPIAGVVVGSPPRARGGGGRDLPPPKNAAAFVDDIGRDVGGVSKGLACAGPDACRVLTQQRMALAADRFGPPCTASQRPRASAAHVICIPVLRRPRDALRQRGEVLESYVYIADQFRRRKARRATGWTAV